MAQLKIGGGTKKFQTSPDPCGTARLEILVISNAAVHYKKQAEIQDIYCFYTFFLLKNLVCLHSGTDLGNRNSFFKNK